MNLDITNKIYHDEDAARAHLEEQLWPNGPTCPHCGSVEATALKGKSHRKGLYQCNDCREQFSVTVGTVFERSKIKLHKWVLAAHLMGASKKGVSSKQLERMLGVTYKTAWFMSMRLREAMTDDVTSTGPVGGENKVVEADETFVGGKKKNVHKGKPEPKKHAVVALVERDGTMRASHVADVTAKTLRETLIAQADRKSYLMTDEAAAYKGVGKEFSGHGSVNHSADEYVRGMFWHTNTAESFFAILKRGVYGTFHSVSEQHLQRYANEFAFRWNARSKLGFDDFERANLLLKGATGKRLTYRRTDAIAQV